MSLQNTFHLRWNNHLQNLQSLFENLYTEQALVDVTISCSDGILHGHKLVLSACSPYFEKVFKDNPCKHPTLILKGICKRDMQLLLEYMYKGAVDVQEDDIEIMLDTATELQIKGLVQNPEEASEVLHKGVKTDKKLKPCKSSSSPQHENDLIWQAELVAKPSGSLVQGNDFHGNSKKQDFKDETNCYSNQKAKVKREDSVEIEPVYLNYELKTVIKKENEENCEEEESEFTAAEGASNSEENMQVDQRYLDNDSSGAEFNWVCHLCSRKFQNKNSYQRHMMTHAGVKPHICTFCSQAFLRLSHLQRHIRVHTGERPYTCAQCHKQFSRSDKLRQHYIIQHNASNTARQPRPRGRPRKVFLQ